MPIKELERSVPVPTISQLTIVDRKTLVSELRDALLKLRAQKVTSPTHKMYVWFATNDSLLKRIKECVYDLQGELKLSHTAYISGGEAVGMEKFDIGGHEVYISVGSDYSL